MAEERASNCPQCATLFSLQDNWDALGFSNVSLAPRESVTANEEEKGRAGYQVELTYDLAGASEIRGGHEAWGRAHDKTFRLRYLPPLQIYLYNLGSRRAKESGFAVDLDTGPLVQGGKEAGKDRVARVKLFVRLTQNALLFYPESLLEG
ncbi:MAG: hypothetical protein P3W93_009570 [Thermus sp.]|nr:hypothetical protein [Thermus sp.]